MEEKLSLLTELIKLARADNELREQEYDFLQTIARSLGVSDEAFSGLFEEYIEFKPPASVFERVLQFHRLVLLMNVDNNTGDAEIDHMKEMGIRMGLSPSATDQVLSEMHKYPDKVIPPGRLIEIFKKQFN